MTTKRERVDQVVLDLLLEHEADGGIPTNGRFVFYELEQRGLATKPAAGDKRPNKRRNIGWPPGQQDISDSLKRLRDRGDVPWDWIVDESRHLAAWKVAPTIAQYLLDTVDLATIDPWSGRPPVLLCESRAAAGVLERVAGQYAVPIAGTGGQCNGFLRTAVAPWLRPTQRIIWLGDLDLSGGHIEASVRRTLEDAIGDQLFWYRLAMTDELAEQYGIEPIQKTDGRTKRTHPAIEVESLGQSRLLELVRTHLEELLPQPLEEVRLREAIERQIMRTRLR